mmetsp:Transcript_21759/g.28136  ORF Transcript_21759/g.28136 Transcript_21759/m.28136 type:complete len:118 (+) Transcript_21759:155-508(+)|eukprot:CAMPEP_0198137708 /NCGR_PEP_ID=MMETSP1443-20131203/1160_1 /TAXON_ID=186043 /ORGANISM="Entomoneis sp., Strain CCMP2396" /LENGTH=117 /DNA_ID=CAMNT_0043799225 /DNA_START=106 /DNA_END=459 /DNA_ORIENTATION=-
MKELAVYLLLQLGGTESPTKDDMEKALSSVGVEMDSAQCDRLLTDLEGKDLAEVMASGKDMLTTFGGGGGGGGGGAAAAGGAAEEVVEEEKEVEEEAEIGGGMDMFGAGDAKEGGDY